MELINENIERIVQYVNIELKKNSKASVNKTGYSFNAINREYTKVIKRIRI